MGLIIFIHGKGGCSEECEHYKSLFPDEKVTGLDYKTFTPWETGKEIHEAVKVLKEKYESIVLIANSIGAFFCMNADIDGMIKKAYFISPIVDMEGLICGMMNAAGVTENELHEKSIITTSSGDVLQWEYLCYVREHPVRWNVPTEILYGRNDSLTSFDSISTFAKKYNAVLTIMEKGEHWFHTDEQMIFLDDWIRRTQ